VEGAGIEGPKIMRFKRCLLKDVPENGEKNFSNNGIATFHGRAHFIWPAAVQVDNDVLQAANVVAAAGVHV
jgi:glutathione reductase (NADPH)